jgi:hypothetical protein
MQQIVVRPVIVAGSTYCRMNNHPLFLISFGSFRNGHQTSAGLVQALGSLTAYSEIVSRLYPLIISAGRESTTGRLALLDNLTTSNSVQKQTNPMRTARQRSPHTFQFLKSQQKHAVSCIKTISWSTWKVITAQATPFGFRAR